MDSSGVLWSPTRNPFWGPKVAGGSTTTVDSRVSLTKVCEFPKERLGLFEGGTSGAKAQALELLQRRPEGLLHPKFDENEWLDKA